MDEVLRLLAAAIATLATTVAPLTVYILRRIRNLEADNTARYQQEQIAKNQRIAELERRVLELETQAQKVPDLERQVNTLTKSLDDLQERYEETEQNYKHEHDANTQLQAKHETVTIERDEARQRIEALTIENAAYRSILVEGAARVQASSGASAPAVTELPVADAQAPAA